MKIGIIKQQFTESGGGLERYTNGLVDQLLRWGHEVHVFARRWDARAESKGLALHRIPVAGGFSFARELSFALACKKAVAQAPCELIFSMERTLRQDICRAGGGCHREWLIQRQRHLSFPQRITLWWNPLHLTLLWLERQTFSPANTRCLIANSHRGKEEIIRHYRFPADRIHVVHNGVDFERFRPAPRPATRGAEFVLLFVGSGFERKGLAFCVRALARLPGHVRLLVAGRGNRRPYERLARRLGVGSRVEFLGAAPQIEAIYARGDVLVHPAIYEPFSNACLEALACGLPVITSRINGASEAIAPGKNGAVVEDPADIAALAEAIRPFLDPKVLAAASAQSRQTAEAMPFYANVERTLEIIRASMSGQTL